MLGQMRKPIWVDSLGTGGGSKHGRRDAGTGGPSQGPGSSATRFLCVVSPTGLLGWAAGLSS